MRTEVKKNLARNKAKREIRYGSEKEIKSYERGASGRKKVQTHRDSATTRREGHRHLNEDVGVKHASRHLGP
jgi:hypothetical protein